MTLPEIVFGSELGKRLYNHKADRKARNELKLCEEVDLEIECED